MDVYWELYVNVLIETLSERRVICTRGDRKNKWNRIVENVDKCLQVSRFLFTESFSLSVHLLSELRSYRDAPWNIKNKSQTVLNAVRFQL